jgi:uncharacterized protein (TIRG00374 family)
LTSARAKLLLVVTNLLSIACLIWVLRGAELDQLGGEIRQMSWVWVLAASVSDITVYVLQAWRWGILLTPVAHIPLMRSIRAIYVGLFANEVLPLRSGEIIRCYLLSRWGSLPLSVTLSSILIERVFDGIWLVLYLAAVVQFVDLPKSVQNGGNVLMLVIALVAGVLGWVIFNKERVKRLFPKSPRLLVLVEDLYLMGNSRSFYSSWLASLPHLLSMTLPIYCVAKAYGLEEIGLGEAAAINVILRLGTVIPNAPGNLGTYQALAVVGLTLFGVEPAQAKRFSLVLWGIVTLPLLLAGFVALSVTGFKITELQKQAQDHTEPAPPAAG